MSRIITLVALALATAAVAVPVAGATTGTQAGTVDPLAVSMLRGKGYTQRQVEAWTVGACSYEQKPAACFGPSKGANLKVGAKVDPLAQSYLLGRGLTPSQVQSWTVGACSHQVKDASCYAMLEQPAAATTAVDPLAVSHLIGLGLSPSQVRSWTVGACSHPTKDAACYAMFKTASTSATTADSVGFRWGDAAIGAAATLGIVFLFGGLGAGLLSRRNRHQQTAHA